VSEQSGIGCRRQTGKDVETSKAVATVETPGPGLELKTLQGQTTSGKRWRLATVVTVASGKTLKENRSLREAVREETPRTTARAEYLKVECRW
jgi:hypothetical protein